MSDDLDCDCCCRDDGDRLHPVAQTAAVICTAVVNVAFVVALVLIFAGWPK